MRGIIDFLAHIRPRSASSPRNFFASAYYSGWTGFHLQLGIVLSTSQTTARLTRGEEGFVAVRERASSLFASVTHAQRLRAAPR